jgi:hypothetical protein
MALCVCVWWRKWGCVELERMGEEGELERGDGDYKILRPHELFDFSGAPVLSDVPGRGPSHSPNEESAEARPV